jgi:peroxiredoxin family protein
MTKVEELKSKIDNIHFLLSGGILKDFLSEEAFEEALPRFQEGLYELTFLNDQLKAELEAEKTKFRREAYEQFQQDLALGRDKSDAIKSGNLVATARYTKEMPYSIPEVHSIFEREGLTAPACKTTIDVKALDSKQKKLYKSLEKITGVTVVVKDISGGDTEEADE